MVADTLRNEAHTDIDMTWYPASVTRGEIGEKLRWVIEDKEGGSPQNWITPVNGDFSNAPATAVWKMPLSASPNREFRVLAWLDKNQDGIWDIAEDHRLLYLSIPVIDTVESPSQNNFGYDEIPGSDDKYISVDKAGTTFADVTIKPFVAKSFWATSSDPSKFTVPNNAVPVTAETTPVENTGMNAGGPKENALLQIRIGSDTGDVVRELHVELYKKRTIELDYYSIVDSHYRTLFIINLIY